MNRFSLAIPVMIAAIITACQAAEPQPVFTPSAAATTTPLPLSSAEAHVAATLAGVIWSFDISPDLSTIAFATSRGAVIYDFNTLAYVHTLAAGENVYSLAWSPDGRRLALGVLKAFQDHGQAALTVWDTADWQFIFEPKFDDGLVNERILDIAWSPDGGLMAVSTDMHGVMVLDARTGQVVSQQNGFASSVMAVSWSPDGSRLVATGDMAYGIRRWKVSTDEAVRLFDPRVSNPMQIAWSPDGKRIASGHAYGTVCFWTAATNHCDGFIQAHRTAVFSLAWSPDGKKLATGGGVIRIWDTQTGGLLVAFGEQVGVIYNHLAWPAFDHPLVTLDNRGESLELSRVRFWDASTGSVLAEFRGGMR